MRKNNGLKESHEMAKDSSIPNPKYQSAKESLYLRERRQELKHKYASIGKSPKPFSNNLSEFQTDVQQPRAMARAKQTNQKSGEALQGASYKRPREKNLTMKAPCKVHFTDPKSSEESSSAAELSDDDNRNAGNGSVIPTTTAGTGT